MKKHIFITAVLVMLMSISTHAQTFNNERMQQDLRISEGILSELVKTDNPSWGGSLTNVNGTYIPGFGIIFETSAPMVWRVERLEVDRNAAPGTTRNAEVLRRSTVERQALHLDADASDQTLEKLEQAIKDYFVSYADVIAQLEPSDRILIVVSNSPTARLAHTTVTIHSGADTKNQGFVMSALKSDITAYRSNRINKETFLSRIRKSELKDEQTPEFRIFSRILETGLSSEVNPSFSLNRSMNHVYDDNIGLVLFGSIRSSVSQPFIFDSEAIRTIDIRGATASTRIHADSIYQIRGEAMATRAKADSLYFKTYSQDFKALTQDSIYISLQDTLSGVVRRIAGVSANLAQVGENIGRELSAAFGTTGPKRSPEEIIEDFDAFENTLKTLMVDYGRTLRELKDGQSLVINLSQRRKIDGIPTRVVATISKSTLNAYDRQQISRDEAMSRVKIQRIPE
jgi:hypothetical protein